MYDNNDIKGEVFDDILKDYISKGFVEILNWRGKKDCMYTIMNDCYRNNYKKYDWLIFYEVDEYIHLNLFTFIWYIIFFIHLIVLIEKCLQDFYYYFICKVFLAIKLL